jgi:urea transport system permease protein
MIHRHSSPAGLLAAGAAHALTADEAKAIAIGESDDRIAALNKAVANADDRTAAFIQAWPTTPSRPPAARPYVVRDGKAATR